jgi:hypothetical protein
MEKVNNNNMCQKIIGCKNHHKEHRNIPFLILLVNSRRGNQWAPTAEHLLRATQPETNHAIILNFHMIYLIFSTS